MKSLAASLSRAKTSKLPAILEHFDKSLKTHRMLSSMAIFFLLQIYQNKLNKTKGREEGDKKRLKSNSEEV